MQNNRDVNSVRKTIDSYIENASHFQVDELERIYHNDLRIIEINENGNVESLSRADAISFFKSKQTEAAKPLSTDAEFNYVEVTGTEGHVVVTRKMKPKDKLSKSVVSISLIWEDDRWQIIRQTAFVQPIE